MIFFLKKFIRFEGKIILKVLLTKPNRIYSQLTVSLIPVMYYDPLLTTSTSGDRRSRGGDQVQSF